MLGSNFKQPKQHFVTLRFQFIDRAVSDLCVNAIYECLLNLGGQHGLPEDLPPSCHRASELLEKMFDTSLAATQMVQHQLSHHTPAEPRAPTQGCVHVASANHSICNEMVDLASERGLEAICDMTGHFLLESHSSLAHRRVEL